MVIERTKERVDKTGEIFTPQALVQEILDHIPQEEFADSSKTFCDPAAGTGNFLVEVLQKKMGAGIPAETALGTIYGVELMEDNVHICRQRLLQISGDTKKNREIVKKNIVCANTLRYDFNFNG